MESLRDGARLGSELSRPLLAATREDANFRSMEPPQTHRVIAWYRTPLEPAVLRQLHERNNWLGAAQAGGYLAVMTATGATAYWAAGRWPWPVVVGLVFLHGTVTAFLINAVHELSHGTVFKTRWLNELFVRIFSFLGMHNFHNFRASHTRHHQSTLHQPEDLEVRLPQRVSVRRYLLEAFINVWRWGNWRWTFWQQVRFAVGRFQGEWENRILPPGSGARSQVVRWARFVLAGHAALWAVALARGWWMLPVVVTLTPLFIGQWLHLLCNNSQHIGLRDEVTDFRLCCRTFTTNPVVEFLYWHMNYHIAHHMYAAVPCYRLGQLHRAILHDLPPCPHGLISTWRQIAAIQKEQDKDPLYQYTQPLPAPARV